MCIIITHRTLNACGVRRQLRGVCSLHQPLNRFGQSIKPRTSGLYRKHPYLLSISLVWFCLWLCHWMSWSFYPIPIWYFFLLVQCFINLPWYSFFSLFKSIDIFHCVLYLIHWFFFFYFQTLFFKISTFLLKFPSMLLTFFFHHMAYFLSIIWYSLLCCWLSSLGLIEFIHLIAPSLRSLIIFT